MDIHIITPFIRVHLLPTLIYYFEPMGIIWHPIIGHDLKADFQGKNWIQPVRTKELEPHEMCYRKINDFIDTQPIIDDDYYGFLDDDSMYEPNFFDVIRKQEAKILVFSNYSGDTTPLNDGSEPHPANRFIVAKLSDMGVCKCGMIMCMMKGEILKQTRFLTNHKWDDGRYVEDLRDRFPKDIKFLPDMFVFGNYFQKGRFTKRKKLLKPTWDLPVYIPSK